MLKKIPLVIMALFISLLILVSLASPTWIEDSALFSYGNTEFKNGQCYLTADKINFKDRSQSEWISRVYPLAKTSQQCECVYSQMRTYQEDVGILLNEDNQWDIHVVKRIWIWKTTELFDNDFAENCL